MKMNASDLIGQLVQAVLIEYNGNYEVWLTKMVSVHYPNGGALSDAENAYNALRIEVLIDYLMRLIKFDNQKITNNMCKKFALR